MKSLSSYLTRDAFENKINKIIFDLDETSLECLEMNFRQLLESNHNVLDFNLILEGNRTIWTSKDGDDLKIGDHANSRRDRPIEKGGDGGKRIGQYEIINMFRWSWNNIMDMNYDGKLKPFEYNNREVNAWTIECQCWLNNDKENNNEVIYCGARPHNMTLWGVWMLEENGSKVDIIIKTIFRGDQLKHTVMQERIKILRNGQIQEKYKQV
jgi:hypothetical protein